MRNTWDMFGVFNFVVISDKRERIYGHCSKIFQWTKKGIL